MAISFSVSKSIEGLLAESGRDPSAAAKESALVELFRQGKLTHHELAEALELSRLETDGVLKRHQVTEDLLAPEELESQLRSIRSRDLSA